jgi:hypothetical protein
MSLTPEGRRARARLAAHRRWRPGSSDDELLADLQAARDEHLVDQLEERAPEMTPAQADRVRRIFSGAQ